MQNRFLAVVFALMLAAAPLSVRAEPGCSGCNIVDARVFNSRLVGRQLYYQETFGSAYVPVRATRIDYARRVVYWRQSNGRTGSAPARYFYTSTSRNERQANTGMAVLGALVVGAMAAASSNEESKQRSSSSRSSGNTYHYHYHDSGRAKSRSSSSTTRSSSAARSSSSRYGASSAHAARSTSARSTSASSTRSTEERLCSRQFNEWIGKSRYGAFAHDGRRCGASWGCSSQTQANRAARRRCQMNGGSSCRVTRTLN